jgi:GT2 family glycosyltransferase
MEIILADNGSTDESLAWVKQHFPDISILELKKNYFFAGGNNRAVKHCKNDYVIFLNNDVKVDPMWLHSLHTCIVTNPKSQLFQPKILSAKKPTHFEYAGAAGGFIDRYGYPYCRGRIFDLVEEDTGQYDTDVSIDWAS